MHGDILVGDVRAVLPTLAAESVQMCVTSPPYFSLRDYGVDGQIGLEATVDEYVAQLVAVFRDVRRVLKADGTLWLNLGDSYATSTSAGDKVFGNPEFNRNRPSRAATKTAARAIPQGLKPKDLIGIPWRVAFALQADGWYLRSDIIWAKPNPMPESVTDRPTKAHEYLFLLSKSERYYYDAAAIAEPATCDRMRGPALHPDLISTNGNSGLARRPMSETRNKRSVWEVATQSYSGAHFATFPEALIEPCILAGSRPGDTVLDPFFGSGTTGAVCERLGRNWIGVELNPAYADLARKRTAQRGMALA